MRNSFFHFAVHRGWLVQTALSFERALEKVELVYFIEPSFVLYNKREKALHYLIILQVWFKRYIILETFLKFKRLNIISTNQIYNLHLPYFKITLNFATYISKQMWKFLSWKCPSIGTWNIYGWIMSTNLDQGLITY